MIAVYDLCRPWYDRCPMGIFRYLARDASDGPFIKEVRSTPPGTAQPHRQVTFSIAEWYPGAHVLFFAGSGQDNNDCVPGGSCDVGDELASIGLWRHSTSGPVPVEGLRTELGSSQFSVSDGRPGLYTLGLTHRPNGRDGDTLRVFAEFEMPTGDPVPPTVRRIPIVKMWTAGPPATRRYLVDVAGHYPVSLLGTHLGADSARLSARVRRHFPPSAPLAIANEEFRGGAYVYPVGYPPPSSYWIETTTASDSPSGTLFETFTLSTEGPAPEPDDWEDVEITYAADSRTAQYESWSAGLGRGLPVLRRGWDFEVVLKGDLARTDVTVKLVHRDPPAE